MQVLPSDTVADKMMQLNQKQTVYKTKKHKNVATTIQAGNVQHQTKQNMICIDIVDNIKLDVMHMHLLLA